MNWFQRFTGEFMRSPAGKMLAIAVAQAAIQANVRPWLQERGADMAVSLDPNLGAVQVDIASRNYGQATLLLRAPAAIEAQPANVVPIQQLWQNINIAEELNRINAMNDAAAQQQTN